MAKHADIPKVLVVDDDPDLVAICSTVLESEGYAIDTAYDGYQACHVISATEVDVVLLDVMMPELDGLTVCKMVKADPRTKHLPVIVMSASDRLCTQAKSSGADAVIGKPFDIDQLVSTVNQFAYAN